MHRPSLTVAHRLRWALALALAPVVVACSAADSAPTSTPASTVPISSTTPPAPPAPTTPTAPVPESPHAEQFTQVVDRVMQSMLVPGVVVAVTTPQDRWVRAFGTRTIGAADSVSVDDHFRIGSITKTMVAAVALQVAAEDELRLDAPLSQFVPWLPGGESTTIEQLLTMRSGLFSYTELEEFNRVLDEDPGRIWTPDELVALGSAEAPYFPPGTGYRYSNTNTVLLASIIEDVTGRTIGDLLAERVFGPAGLSRTSFPAPGDRALPSPSPHGYLYGTNVSANVSAPLPWDQVRAAQAGTLLPTDVTSLDPSWIGAAGAAISTAADLTTYAEALVTGELSRDQELSRRQLDIPRTGGHEMPVIGTYGLGLMAFGPLYGHDGAIPGFQSFMGHDPDTGITVVVLCTLRDGPAGGRPANEIAAGIVRVLYAE